MLDLLTNYLPYKLGDSYSDLKEELVFVKSEYGYKYYESIRYSTITFFGKELRTTIYLEFNKENKVYEINLHFHISELNYIRRLLDSFAMYKEEKLHQNLLGSNGELSLNCFNEDYSASITIVDDEFIRLDVGDPILCD